MTGFRKENQMTAPVVAWLESLGWCCSRECSTPSGFYDIAAAKYGPRPRPRQKPPVTDLIMVELKLSDVAGVIQQAKNNRHWCCRSYAAMPESRISRFQKRTTRAFIDAGVGLIEVGDEIQIVIPAATGKGISRRVSESIWNWRRRHSLPCLPADLMRRTAA